MSDKFENEENNEIEETEETEEMQPDETSEVDQAAEKAVGEAELADAELTVIGTQTDFEDTDGTESAVEPSVEYTVADEELDEELPKKKSGVVLGVVIAIVAALLVGAGAMCLVVRNAPYNYLGYINVSGRTVGDVAAEQGMEASEFLKNFNLPEDMPSSTIEEAAYYTLPAKTFAAMYGMDFETLKMLFKIPDTVSEVPLRWKIVDLLSDKFNIPEQITEDTPWGIVEGEITVGEYVGEEMFEDFKEEYGFGDEITLETKWRNVRRQVDLVNKKRMDEMKNSEPVEDDGTAPDIDVVPEDGNAVPDIDAVPENGDTVPENGDTVPENGDTAPENDAASANTETKE